MTEICIVELQGVNTIVFMPSNFVQFFNRMEAILICFNYNGIRISYLDSSTCIDLILTEFLFLRLS